MGFEWVHLLWLYQLAMWMMMMLKLRKKEWVLLFCGEKRWVVVYVRVVWEGGGVRREEGCGTETATLFNYFNTHSSIRLGGRRKNNTGNLINQVLFSVIQINILCVVFLCGFWWESQIAHISITITIRLSIFFFIFFILKGVSIFYFA